MNIDLTKLVTSYVEEIEVNGEIVIPDNMFLGTEVRALRDVKFDDPHYYTAKNIPATGYYLKDNDREDTQLSLF